MMMRVYASLGGLILIALIIWGVVTLNHHATPVAADTSPTPSSSAAPTTLQSTDEVVGTGATVKEGDSITVKYTGTLADGSVFDSTEKDGGQPATFTLAKGQLIDGWVQGIPGMKVGGTRKLVIPPSLGYGAQANGAIPANSTLTFVIQLISVN